MAFTIQDYLDLVRLLAEHPEWRSELRRLLLSEELLALPEIVRDLAEAQRRAEERLGRVEDRLGRLEAVVTDLAEAQRRAEERLGYAEERLGRVEDRLGRVEGQLEGLESTTKTLVDDVGTLKGCSLEMTYRDKASAYFGSMLLRTRVMTSPTLGDLLEAQLSAEEYTDVLLSDLIVKGKPRQRPGASEVFLVVEISAVVDREDLERAQRRARLLRHAGYRAIPVITGQRVIPEVENEARLQQVVVLQDGKVSFWEEALQTWIAS